jgi:HPt (histidine-containing phosphotransfer) domain-containing protein
MAKIATLALVAINFLVILFYLIAHLRRNDQALERAQKETADILRTTQEGLFLLDPQYIIGTQHSRVLEGIIGTAEFSGTSFFALLQPMVTEKTLATAREYLELLFKHDVKEKLVADLNPLNCVQILYGQGTGKPETRYLEFGFNRVKEGKQITHLLVTVNDITQRINLERSLKETEARTRHQSSMLIELLQIEPAALQQFMRTAREGLHNMNDLLQKQETGLDARGSKVHALFRHSHRIKGDASGLGLKNIAASFERLEDTLTGMHERHNLTGEDFLPIAVQVKTLYEQIEAIELLIAQISQARGIVTIESSRMPQEPGTDQLPFVERWRSFATEIATRQGNAVEVAYTGLDIATLPTALQDAANTLVNQFIRNAVAHGIEPPEERKRLNKPAAGRLSIYISRRDDGGIDLGFRDDGRGISVEHIRQAAIDKGRLTPEAAATLEPRRIIGLIFEPGMSTRQTVDGDAGRGAGLDAVRDIVMRMGGNIRLGTTVNEYCHFRISLAAPAPDGTPAGAAA